MKTSKQWYDYFQANLEVKRINWNQPALVTTSELKNIPIARKSLVAICNIKKGDLFSEKNLGVKRPGNGISPMRWNELIGQPARRDFAVDELIDL